MTAQDAKPPLGGPTSRYRNTIFWRVAAVLVGVQLTTAVLAAGFTVWYARDQSRDLAASSLRARLDAVAEEIERRADHLASDSLVLSAELEYDLGFRFPDPIALVDLEGAIIRVFRPDSAGFAGVDLEPDARPLAPAFLNEDGAFEGVTLRLDDADVEGGFAFAPLFDDAGFPVGGVLVQPLTASLDWELADSRSAFVRSVGIVAVVAALVALLLGAIFTWRLVLPVRRIARRVEEIGDGQFDSRVVVRGGDEFASLAASVNHMAYRIQQNIEALTRADLVRRELVANVGHDLRTPLAALRAGLEEAGRFQAEGRVDELRDLLPRIERQAAFMHRLVEDLFELAVLEAGAPVLRLEPVLLAELTGDALDSVRAVAGREGVELVVRLEPDLPVFEGDGLRLLRMLTNLLSNAVRHSGDEGRGAAGAGARVVVAITRRAQEIQIRISDSGPGIRQEDREKVFKRYYRGAGPRTRDEAAGTGLGLPIARAIARAHGGDLEIEGGAPGGATILVRLPLRAPRPQEGSN